MNFTGSTSTKPKVFKNFCIRDYVAEVRKKDWKKCCPFNLWDGSEESNRRAEIVYASLFLENDDDLVNSQENTEAPNFATASEVGICEVQAAVSETHTSIISQSSIEVSDADGLREEIVTEDHVRLLKNDKQERNLVGLEPQKFRMLSEIYKELDDSGDDLSSDDDNKSCNDSIYYSDDVTLNTFIRGVKQKYVERRMISDKKEHENDIDTETDYDSDEFTLATILRNKRKTPPAVAPRVVGAKRAKPVSEDHSCGRSSECSSKRRLRSIRTAPAPASLGGEENICESPPSSDDDMMAANILFRMSNGGVQTKTLSKTAAEEQAVSKAKGKGLCEDDGHVPPAAGYGLLEDIMNRISVCVINRNPSEFETEEAKKFRRRC